MLLRFYIILTLSCLRGENMVTETLIVGLINLIAGILILSIRGSLRFIVGGYLLLTGVIMVVLQLM